MTRDDESVGGETPPQTRRGLAHRSRWVRVAASAALALAACRVGDLLTTPQSAPAAPADLTQRPGDDTTSLDPGAAVHDSIVILSAVASDPDAADSLRLQIEVRPFGTAFADSATAVSATVANGSAAPVPLTGLAENGAYHWQARTLDLTGRTSAWTPFGRGASQPDFFLDDVPDPPGVPGNLAQLRSDSVTVLPVGGATAGTTVVFRGTLTDPDPGDSLRLQVEAEPLGVAFTDIPSATSLPVAGGEAGTVTLTGETVNTSYHWQARAIDGTDSTSAWVPFGGNSENRADYTIATPTPPDPPGDLGQYRQNGQTVIAPGDTTSQSTIVFKATVSDPDGDQVRLEIEVQPFGTPFAGVATATSTLVTSGGQQQASIDLSGLATGDYHWQARAVDQVGSTSAWVPFGTGTAPDFGVR